MRPLTDTEQKILIAAMADYLKVLREWTPTSSEVLQTAELLGESIAFGLIVYDDDK